MIAKSFCFDDGDPYTYCKECQYEAPGPQSCSELRGCPDSGCGAGLLKKGLQYSQCYNPDKFYEKTLFD